MPFVDDEYVPCWNIEYSDVWNLNKTIALFLADAIDAWLKGGVNSYPASLVEQSPDEWEAILTKMRDDFRLYANEDDVSIDESLDLFKKWFYDLWD